MELQLVGKCRIKDIERTGEGEADLKEVLTNDFFPCSQEPPMQRAESEMQIGTGAGSRGSSLGVTPVELRFFCIWCLEVGSLASRASGVAVVQGLMPLVNR